MAGGTKERPKRAAIEVAQRSLSVDAFLGEARNAELISLKEWDCWSMRNVMRKKTCPCT